MQILKFGGSSVENADNINRVAGIIKKASRKDKTIVVVSAMGGITDTLLKTAVLAAAGDKSYTGMLTEIENRHVNVIRTILPVKQQSALLKMVKSTCENMAAICNGAR